MERVSGVLVVVLRTVRLLLVGAVVVPLAQTLIQASPAAERVNVTLEEDPVDFEVPVLSSGDNWATFYSEMNGA